MSFNKNIAALIATALLAGCGGGGGGGGGGAGLSGPRLTVTPSLGCFRNVEVTVFDLQSGQSVGSGKVGSTGCQASISLSNYSGGPVVLKAALIPQPANYDATTYCNDTANAACFFNEGTAAWEPYVYSGGLDAMLAPLPSLDYNKQYGLNKITNALAASLSIPSNFDTDPAALATVKAAVTKDAITTQSTQMLNAFAALGLSDIFSPPKVLAASAQDIANMKSSTQLDGFSALFLRDALEKNPLSSVKSYQDSVSSGSSFATVFSSIVTATKSFVDSDSTTRAALIQSKQGQRTQEKELAQSASGVTVQRVGGTFSQSDFDVVPSTQTSVLRVVPMLGQFSQGATVELINPLQDATTKVLATATVNADGYANVTLPAGLESSFIVKVYDNTSQVTYYDAGRGTTRSLGNKPLYALVPANKRIGDGAVIGVTVVTDMAAALAGVGIGSEAIPVAGQGDARLTNVYNSMITAYARAIYLLGWTSSKTLTAAYQLNPLLPPTRVTATKLSTLGIDLGQAGGVWAAYFTELSKAAYEEGFQDTISWVHSTSSNGDVGLRAVVEGIKADIAADTNNIVFSSELVSTIFRAANKAMFDGPQYADACVEIPTSTYAPILKVFEKSSTTNPDDDFKSTTISALVLELKDSMSVLLNGNPKRLNLDRTLKTSCVANS